MQHTPYVSLLKILGELHFRLVRNAEINRSSRFRKENVVVWLESYAIQDIQELQACERVRSG